MAALVERVSASPSSPGLLSTPPPPRESGAAAAALTPSATSWPADSAAQEAFEEGVDSGPVEDQDDFDVDDDEELFLSGGDPPDETLRVVLFNGKTVSIQQEGEGRVEDELDDEQDDLIFANSVDVENGGGGGGNDDDDDFDEEEFEFNGIPDYGEEMDSLEEDKAPSAGF